MININRHSEIFEPNDDFVIHIIGCGAVGSYIAQALVRVGFKTFVLWDNDVLESHNIANQAYFTTQLGLSKTEALHDILKNINPSVKIYLKGFFDEKASFNGFSKQIVLCLVDSPDARKLIFDKAKYNNKVKLFIETRMGLYNYLVYAINPMIENQVTKYLESLTVQFAPREVSSCGSPLALPFMPSAITATVVRRIMMDSNPLNWNYYSNDLSFNFEEQNEEIITLNY